ncbi:hypothetical protein CSW62_20270 [Caulobacter sp. FWC2]|nr:hypothetical protein CSW62_20270 [Caulobacter sp. FWC2]
MKPASHSQGDKTMSDLIDRYLAAVAALLPKDQRQDIIAELRDLIMNRVEEQEAVLRRPLDKREIEALLRDIGHPIAVAGRYGPRTALIGPELYPFWEFGVKVLLAIAAIAAIVPAGILLVTGHGGPHTISGVINDFIASALTLIGCATLVGAAVERGWIKLGDFSQWKASDLPHIPQGKGLFVKSRFEGLFELIVTLLFIAWWTRLLPFPMGALVHDGGDVGIALSPVLTTLYWPILALSVVQALSSLILVVKPGWVRPRASLELICSLGGLALVAILWPAQPLITLMLPDAPGENLAHLQRTVDLTFKVMMVVAAGVYLIKLFVDGRRLVRGK